MPSSSTAPYEKRRSLNTTRRLSAGRCTIGRKIGLTSAAIQRQLGVDRPDLGILCDDMLYEGDEVSVPIAALLQPKIVAAFGWLADLAIEQGEPLRRGEIVLTGALGAMVPFTRGKRYKLEIARFAPSSQTRTSDRQKPLRYGG